MRGSLLLKKFVPSRRSVARVYDVWRVESYTSMNSVAGCWLEVSQCIFAPPVIIITARSTHNPRRTPRVVQRYNRDAPAAPAVAAPIAAPPSSTPPPAPPSPLPSPPPRSSSSSLDERTRARARARLRPLGRTGGGRRLHVSVLYAGQWLGRVHSAAHAPVCMYICMMIYRYKRRDIARARALRNAHVYSVLNMLMYSELSLFSPSLSLFLSLTR